MRTLFLSFSFAAAMLYGQDDPGHCSNATIKGGYGYQISGTRPSGPNGPIENAIGVLVRVFDGAGNFTQIDNVKGAISGWVPDRPGSGTYTINDDCSGIMTLHNTGIPFPIVERVVVVNAGAEIRSAVMEPAAVMVTATARRMLGDWLFTPWSY
jgi:hypothetical protein